MINGIAEKLSFFCYNRRKEGGNMNDLTPKQRAFCEEYLKDFNATRAYKVVYKNIKSDEVAYAASSRLLRHVKVKDYIEKVNNKAMNKRILTLEQLKEFYTSVVASEEVEMKDRISAADKLAKYIGISEAEKQKFSIDREKLEIEKAKNRDLLEIEKSTAEKVGDSLKEIMEQIKHETN